MKKVVYSITKFGKEETKNTGIGYVVDEKQLLIPQYSERTKKAYIKEFDIENKLVNIINNGQKTNQYKANIYELYINKDNQTIQTEYSIWLMEVE